MQSDGESERKSRFFPHLHWINMNSKRKMSNTPCVSKHFLLFLIFAFEELHFIPPVCFSFCCWVFTIAIAAAVAFGPCIILLPVPLYMSLSLPTLCVLHFHLFLKPNFDLSIFSISPISLIYSTSVFHFFLSPLLNNIVFCLVSKYCIHISAF